MTVNIWKSHMWTVDKEMNVEAIFVVMNTTYPVSSGSLKKLIKTSPQCACKLSMQSTVLVSQRSWVQILYRPEFFSGLIFHFCLNSVYYCQDHFHIHFFISSLNIWFSFIYSPLLCPYLDKFWSLCLRVHASCREYSYLLCFRCSVSNRQCHFSVSLAGCRVGSES